MQNNPRDAAAWAGQGQGLSLPSWDQLPAIPLYMDQVLLYLSDQLAFFQRQEDTPLLTSSMINNYVKNGVLPHPEKKKYSRGHLAALVVVGALKQVLSIQDIKALLAGKEPPEELYSLFLEAQLQAVHETCQELSESLAAGKDIRQEALRLAAEANAKRAAAERLLSGSAPAP